MSKYSSYAERLDTAFKDARKRFEDAYDAVEMAKAGIESAKSEENPRDRALLIEEGTVNLHKAEAALDLVNSGVWPALDDAVTSLTVKLKEAVKADSIADPSDIDANGLTLLQSGVLRIDEIEHLLDLYSDNVTMSRIIGKYAKTAADGEKDHEKRRRLEMIARKVDEGANIVLAAWDGLLEAVRVCSGRSRGEAKPDPSFVHTIAKRWEQLTEDTVESF